jgi:hypothetical protein
MNRLHAAQSPDSIEPKPGLKRDITVYLGKVGFVERVMTDILEVPGKTRKTLLWASFCLFNLFLLVLFGTNQAFVVEFFALQEELGQFFFLFLGITLLGGLIGLVLVSDISWLKDYLPNSNTVDD